MALTNCEAPNGAAVAGQVLSAEAGTGTTKNMGRGFQKKLLNFEAMIIVAQQPTAGGSIVNADDGIQADSGTLVEASGTGCILEGFEMPQHLSGVVETAHGTLESPALIPESDKGMTQDANQTVQHQTDTTGPIAWTQNTTAGDTPVKPQDNILKTIGDYLEAMDFRAQEAAGQTEGNLRSNVPEREDGVIPTGKDTVTSVSGNGVTNVSETTPTIAPDTADGDAERSAAGLLSRREAQQAEPLQAAQAPQGAGVLAPDAYEPSDVVNDAAPNEEPQLRTDQMQYCRENVLRIVDKVSTRTAQERYEFDVELKPDFLGKVSIKLTMEDGNIRMQIKTDDMSVRSMLSDQTSALQSALKEKGVELTSVDIAYQSQTSFDGGGGRPFEEQNGNAWQSSPYYAQADAAATDAVTESYSYYVGNSSVEYLA